MRAARLEERRQDLVIGDFPKPEITSTEVLVKVSAVSICRTDWHQWNGDWEWLGFLFPLPVIPGHEFAGVVEEVGADVTKIKVGDRVTVPYNEGCGTCASCTGGASNHCVAPAFPGFTHSGAYGEYVAVPYADFNCVVLPDSVDTVAAASLGCRYMSAYRAITTQGRLTNGEYVAIHGVGGTGLAAVQIAKQLGGHVIAVDKRQAALEKAAEEGADVLINSSETPDVIGAIREATEGGAHLSLDATGGQETTVNGIASLRPFGRFVQAGMTSKDLQGNVVIPMDLVVALEIEIRGTFGNPRSDYDELLALVARGDLKPERLITRRANISEINEIIADLDNFNTIGFNVVDSFAPNAG